MEHKRSDLNQAIRRNIKYKEQHLNKKCRKIWDSVNTENIKYLYGIFACKDEETIVTLGYYNEYIHKFCPCY